MSQCDAAEPKRIRHRLDGEVQINDGRQKRPTAIVAAFTAKT